MISIYLSELNSILDSNSILIVTSDSNKKTSSSFLPLLISKRSFNGTSFNLNEASFENESITNYDLASSLSYILSLNIPKHNQGIFIKSLITISGLSSNLTDASYFKLLNQREQLLISLKKSK